MKLKLTAGALALAAMAPLAQAEVAVTPAVLSDYDFRGISLSARDPAVQLDVLFSNSSPFTFDLWASTTDLGTKTDLELDATVAVSGGNDEIANWTAGLTYYSYFNESEFNYPEAFVGVSKSFNDTVSGGLKLWYSNDLNASSESATYLEANVHVNLPNNFGLDFHAARSDGNYWDLVNGDGYTDFSLGLSYSWNDINFGLKYVDGSDLPDAGEDILSTESKVVFSVSKTFSFGGKKD